MPAQPHDRQLQRDLEALGAAIVKAREKKGWTQEATAVELQMSRSYYADVERGARNISIRNLLRICRTLDVKPGKLLDSLV